MYQSNHYGQQAYQQAGYSQNQQSYAQPAYHAAHNGPAGYGQKSYSRSQQGQGASPQDSASNRPKRPKYYPGANGPSNPPSHPPYPSQGHAYGHHTPTEYEGSPHQPHMPHGYMPPVSPHLQPPYPATTAYQAPQGHHSPHQSYNQPHQYHRPSYPQQYQHPQQEYSSQYSADNGQYPSQSSGYPPPHATPGPSEYPPSAHAYQSSYYSHPDPAQPNYQTRSHYNQHGDGHANPQHAPYPRGETAQHVPQHMYNQRQHASQQSNNQPYARSQYPPHQGPPQSTVPYPAQLHTKRAYKPHFGGAVESRQRVDRDPAGSHAAGPTDGGSDSAHQGLYQSSDDWDFDFDGALWPKGNDSVDPNLSLGIIIWHPAVQVTRALPSDFFEAEESATKPPPKPLSNGESVSIYFTLDNSHEAFLNVRQTDDWFNVKDDPVFLEFPLRDEFVPLSEVIKSRMRPDLSSGENADTKTVEDWSDSAKSQSHNVMDNLEMALQHHNNNNAVRQAGPEEVKLDAKVTESPITQNNAEQEDILARLGVTGSPKPIAEDPAHSYSAEDGASNRLDYSAYEKNASASATNSVFLATKLSNEPLETRDSVAHKQDDSAASQPSTTTRNNQNPSPSSQRIGSVEGFQSPSKSGDDDGSPKVTGSPKADASAEDSSDGPIEDSQGSLQTGAQQKRNVEEADLDDNPKHTPTSNQIQKPKRRQIQVASAYRRR